MLVGLEPGASESTDAWAGSSKVWSAAHCARRCWSSLTVLPDCSPRWNWCSLTACASVAPRRVLQGMERARGRICYASDRSRFRDSLLYARSGWLHDRGRSIHRPLVRPTVQEAARGSAGLDVLSRGGWSSRLVAGLRGPCDPSDGCRCGARGQVLGCAEVYAHGNTDLTPFTWIRYREQVNPGTSVRRWDTSRAEHVVSGAPCGSAMWIVQ